MKLLAFPKKQLDFSFYFRAMRPVLTQPPAMSEDLVLLDDGIWLNILMISASINKFFKPQYINGLRICHNMSTKNAISAYTKGVDKILARGVKSFVPPKLIMPAPQKKKYQTFILLSTIYKSQYLQQTMSWTGTCRRDKSERY